MVKWKFPTVALESEQRGQACIEGLIFLQKTRRPFVFVLLSNFEKFFFKVERDQGPEQMIWSILRDNEALEVLAALVIGGKIRQPLSKQAEDKLLNLGFAKEVV